MKQVIVGMGFLVIAVLTLLILMALGKENTKENILTQSVELAMYQSLEEAIINNLDPGELFETNLSKILGEAEIYIEIHESSVEKGILSVTVKEIYKSFGAENDLYVTRTVIYERKSME